MQPTRSGSLLEPDDKNAMSMRDRRLRSLVAWYFACILAVIGWLGYRNMRMRGDWSMADWLINYSGGFVRRGFAGQIALLVSRLHVSPFAFVLAVQLALYAVLFYTVWRLLDGARWSLGLIALIFSPATLIYPLLDPLFAFRKEELLFATLCGLLLLLLRRPVHDLAVSVFLTAAGVVCVLSHEGLALYSGYLFSALLMHLGSWRRTLRIAIAPALAILLAFGAVSRFPGDLAVSQTICASIGSTLTDPPTGLCSGAIAYLAHDKAYARNGVLSMIGSGRYPVLVLRLAVLALLPFLFAYAHLWRKNRLRPELKIWAATTLGSFVLTIPLFLYAIDWTRWIYIHALCMFLLLLSIERRLWPWDRQESAHERILPASPWRRALVVLLLLAYLWGWDLGEYQPRFPYGGLAHYLYQQRRSSYGSVESHSLSSAERPLDGAAPSRSGIYLLSPLPREWAPPARERSRQGLQFC